ncbi:kinase-like domain-containing protein [Jimgerdemannia flammicorona]|uniref:Kinase-like domain-containing protein n=1 Tax=Jimgerdemannia flammicorona TaxID=994334 RepID=A0A433A0U6_9FUNG|nr:kinase-like domain-containing protein [Jimgerdemannia flammicorona]
MTNLEEWEDYGEFISSKGFAFSDCRVLTNFVAQVYLISQDQPAILKEVDTTSSEYEVATYLRGCTSPQNHTVRFLDILHPEGKKKAILVMPCLSGFLDFPLKTPQELLDLIMQTLEGLAFMHSHNITHSDITPANVMIDVDLDDDFNEISPRRYCFIDFGLSQKLGGPHSTILNRFGTKHYTAPEVSDQTSYNPFKADVWALGQIISEFVEKMENDGTVVPPDIRQLVVAMQKPADKRLTAQAVLEMSRNLTPDQTISSLHVSPTLTLRVFDVIRRISPFSFLLFVLTTIVILYCVWSDSQAVHIGFFKTFLGFRS